MTKEELKAKIDEANKTLILRSGLFNSNDTHKCILSLIFDGKVLQKFCGNCELSTLEKRKDVAIKIQNYLTENNITFIAINAEEDNYIITERGELFMTKFKLEYYTVDINLNKLPEYVKELLKEFKHKKNNLFHMVYNSGQYFTFPLEKVEQEYDIELNYNSDLPDKEIKDFLNKDGSGIIILDGIPGSGKTSYIKYLIKELDEKKFIFINQHVLNSVDDASLISILSDNKNSIFIIEDCEGLIQNNGVRDPRLSSLLNLSDGILGDGFGTKFILTFNKDISKVDPAILRKGRLKARYRFDKLCLEKSIKLAKKLGNTNIPTEPMTLSDIYNPEIVFFNVDVKKKTVGF